MVGRMIKLTPLEDMLNDRSSTKWIHIGILHSNQNSISLNRHTNTDNFLRLYPNWTSVN